MCLLAVVYQTIPNCPVLVLANREEFIDRPSGFPEVAQGHNPLGSWLGGRDLRAGGTWLGINRTGLIVAVTNRPKTHPPNCPKSRGLLCREVLEQGEFEAAVAEFHRQQDREEFAGFNLMLLSRERGLVFSAGDPLQIQPITPGVHAVANGDWDDPADPRIRRIRRLLREFHQTGPTLEGWIQEAQLFCGLGEEAEGDALCLPCVAGRGTVSSSLLMLPDDLHKARFLHAPASPAARPYDDLSPGLVSFLRER